MSQLKRVQLLTKEQFAGCCNISMSQLNRLIKTGKVKPVMVGNQQRFNLDDILKPEINKQPA